MNVLVILIFIVSVILILNNKTLDNFTPFYLNKNKYHKFVLDSYTHGEINKLVNFILEKINKDKNMSFVVLNYEKIKKIVYSNLSKRYTILLVIYEKSKFVSKRVIIDFLVNNYHIKLLSIKLGGSFEHILNNPKSNSNLISYECIKDTSYVNGNKNIPLEYSLLTTEEKQEYSNRCNLNQWILPKELDCVIFKFNNEISQFYIYASSEKFLSNTKAVESIKYNNTEELVRNFTNDLTKIKPAC